MVPLTKIVINRMRDIMKNLVCLLIDESGRKIPPMKPKEYVQVLSYKGFINQSVEFSFFWFESCAINRLGRVQTSRAMSLAVAYLIKWCDVMLPNIIPRPRQEFIMEGAEEESIWYPTFIASPSAQAEKKSEIQGTTQKAATKEQAETNCIFFLMSSIQLNYVKTKNKGKTQ